MSTLSRRNVVTIAVPSRHRETGAGSDGTAYLAGLEGRTWTHRLLNEVECGIRGTTKCTQRCTQKVGKLDQPA